MIWKTTLAFLVTLFQISGKIVLIKNNIDKSLLLLLFLGLSSVNLVQAQIIETTNPTDVSGIKCVSQDFSNLTFFLGDINGDPIENCSAGTEVSAYIWVISNNNPGRYNLWAQYTLTVTDSNNNFSTNVYEGCKYEGEEIPATGKFLISEVLNWTCGSTIDVSQFYISWQERPSNTCEPSGPKCLQLTDFTRVETPVVANFDYVQNCESYATKFTNLTTGGEVEIYSYSWDFDGIETSTEENPTFVFPSAGIYTVSLTSTQGDQTDTFIDEVVIFEPLKADAPENVEACDSYALPTLENGAYFASTGGVDPIAAGTEITATQTIYVFTAGEGSCEDAENSFTVTINDTPVAQSFDNEVACDSYTLKGLNDGNQYFTQPGGQGTELFENDVIAASQVIYVYTNSGVNVVCSNESSFSVTINPTPSAPIVDNTINTTCDLNNGSISIVLIEGIEYSIDGENFQTSGDFNNLAPNTYSISARFINGDCISAITEIEIIAIPDTENPVLSELENIVVNTDTGICSATVNFEVPTATDNCEGTVVTLTEGLASGSAFPVGITTVQYTATDASGNSTSISFTVTVLDNEAPAADMAELPTVTGECAATVTVVPTATDNCGGIINGTTEDLLTYNEQGTYTITWTFDDGNGNITTQEQTVIVDDITAPVVDAAELPTVTGECSAIVTVVPTATDNCGGIINGTTNDPLTYNEQGTYTITWTFDDGNGNITTQEQTVIVDDVTAPVADVAELPTVTGECSATVTAVPTATDNCGGTINGTTNDPLTYTEQGTYTITWTFDDGNGNITTQEQTVIVND
ncbi:MAG: HYR domain-containing protein, partial [Gillisia sp.]